MLHWFSQFIPPLPPYGVGGLMVLAFYAIQSELRFGAAARSHLAGGADRGSSLVVSLASLVTIFGFVLAMSAQTSTLLSGLLRLARVPAWVFAPTVTPGMPGTAWAGVMLGCVGLAVRLWAVLTLRHRYTRTLQVNPEHVIERSGPYRFVRHPGYLGSLLCLNGLALASGSAVVFAVSLAATLAAYAYRVRVEDEMLLAEFGSAYGAYRRATPALLPFIR